MKASPFFSQFLRPSNFKIFIGSVLNFEQCAILRLKALQKLASYAYSKLAATELVERYSSIISSIGLLFSENAVEEKWLTTLPFSTTPDALSYWLLRFAFASDSAAMAWHVGAEKVLLVARLMYAFCSSGSDPQQLLASLGAPYVDFKLKDQSKSTSALFSFYLHIVSDLLVSDDGRPVLFSLTSLLRQHVEDKSPKFDTETTKAINYLRQMCPELVQEMGYVETSLSSFYLIRRDKFPACAELASRRVPCIGGMFFVAPENLISLVFIQLETVYGASQHVCEAIADIQIPQFAEILEIVRLTKIDANNLDTHIQIDENRRLSLRNIGNAVRAGCIPPCMVYCINGLKANNRLKHQARLQLTSFFNSCGMSCEDDLAYQKSFYTKIMSEEKFTRDYAYNIKHVHGRVGGRKQTMCSGCNTISSLIPRSDGKGEQQMEVHGCPFVHLYDGNIGDPTKLKAFLQANYKVTAHETDIEDKIACSVSNQRDKGWLGYITAPLKTGEPKVACNHLFELVHGEVRIDAMHPVKFFKESTEVLAAAASSLSK